MCHPGQGTSVSWHVDWVVCTQYEGRVAGWGRVDEGCADLAAATLLRGRVRTPDVAWLSQLLLLVLSPIRAPP